MSSDADYELCKQEAAADHAHLRQVVLPLLTSGEQKSMTYEDACNSVFGGAHMFWELPATQNLDVNRYLSRAWKEVDDPEASLDPGEILLQNTDADPDVTALYTCDHPGCDAYAEVDR